MKQKIVLITVVLLFVMLLMSYYTLRHFEIFYWTYQTDRICNIRVWYQGTAYPVDLCQ